jgi:hypothetical protein
MNALCRVKVSDGDRYMVAMPYHHTSYSFWLSRKLPDVIRGKSSSTREYGAAAAT